MKKIITSLILVLVFLGETTAQILPPDFRCVRGDTLFWDIPMNSCGPFVSYEIWASQSPAGPFVLQGTVANQSQGFFDFVNPSGEQWYFYLKSNFNCPGQLAISSDTLDNRPPLVSPIQSVSVESGQAVVTWSPSPSPEVFAYVIYRQTSIGVVPVDTVFGGTTFIDPNADPTAGPESYFVNALDPCGNTSIFDVKHTSVFLEAETVPCRQSLLLTWNTYEGWTNGIAEQQIWAGINGGALVLADDAGSGIGSFELENVVDGATYCLEVRSEESVTGTVAKSNQVCIVADIVQTVEDILLENVSVTGNGDVELSWSWNPMAELADYQILRSEQNAGYQAIATEPANPPLTATNSYSDAMGSAASGKVFYKIQARDVCDSVLATSYGSTIFLKAAPVPGNINRLEWTAYDFENASASAYTVFKIVSGSEVEVATVGSGITNFEDSYDPTSLADAQACYYVLADAQVTTPTGASLQRESRSNIACVEQDARIYVPNAFVPEGVNQEFKPLIVLGDIAKYELKVFDRYGQAVFVTNDPGRGWDGRKNGKTLAQGLYAYTINVTQASGKVSEKRGTVLLLQ